MSQNYKDLVSEYDSLYKSILKVKDRINHEFVKYIGCNMPKDLKNVQRLLKGDIVEMCSVTHYYPDSMYVNTLRLYNKDGSSLDIEVDSSYDYYEESSTFINKSNIGNIGLSLSKSEVEGIFVSASKIYNEFPFDVEEYE